MKSMVCRDDVIRAGACSEEVDEWIREHAPRLTAIPVELALRFSDAYSRPFIEEAAGLGFVPLCLGRAGQQRIANGLGDDFASGPWDDGDGCGYGNGYGYLDSRVGNGFGDGEGRGAGDGFGNGRYDKDKSGYGSPYAYSKDKSDGESLGLGDSHGDGGRPSGY